MDGYGSHTLIPMALLCLFVLLFNGKTLKPSHIIHTVIAMLIVSRLLYHNYGDWFALENNMPTLAFISTIAMSVVFVLVLTQSHRQPYTQLLKKEILGEWANYENKS